MPSKIPQVISMEAIPEGVALLVIAGELVGTIRFRGASRYDILRGKNAVQIPDVQETHGCG